MKTLILSCSPRVGGNCDIITDSVMRHISNAQVYRTRDMNYSPCDGCGFCEAGGECRHEDDATRFYADLSKCDALIVVAPVYFYSFDARTKGVIDRAQYLWGQRKTRRIPVYLIACGGQSGENNFTYMQKVALSWSFAFGGDYKGGLFFPDTDAAGDILKDSKLDKVSNRLIKWGFIES